ncbi:LysR family transcriptional regulator [Ovoidimarina sediminis]|uniref:LysR family transcriptional regulator n=1 Tax=Ovoidimarina sediminis TaxID=3079856 RepID=UPI002906B0ED|nr:LysR family transcriptional regulator [Rhodophyticola sp. MJ-SS7]MDU8942711.1 LysR family transcriptional regulator [Rhodophyticola sp. MJ-SS7]
MAHGQSQPATPAETLEWNDLSLILAICRAESLSGAARRLGQTHSTVFRRINAVEEKTGVRFFDRFRKGYVMTDAGRVAMEHAERIEAEVLALGREILGRDTALRGRVRVTCPEAFAEEHAPGIIASFCAAYPEIQVDLSPGHGAVDLNRREAEVAIRATKAPPEASFGRRIGDFRFAFYATPAYLEATAGQPFAAHRLCLIEGTAAWLAPLFWPTPEEGAARAVFQCRASRAVQNACAMGLGLAFLPCYVGDADIRLVRATGPVRELDMELWVLTHPDLRGTRRVRALMSHFYEALGREADLWAGRRPQPGGTDLRPAG